MHTTKKWKSQIWLSAIKNGEIKKQSVRPLIHFVGWWMYKGEMEENGGKKMEMLHLVKGKRKLGKEEAISKSIS